MKTSAVLVERNSWLRRLVDEPLAGFPFSRFCAAHLRSAPATLVRPHRVLILSVSAGAGHVRAAQALCAASDDMPDMEAIHLDAMDFVPRFFRVLYSDCYLRLVRSWPAL